MPGRGFTFLFMEERKDRAERLEAEIETLWSRSGAKPTNVGVDVWNTTFQHGVDGILDILSGERLAPTFAFVDPFGWSGAPMEVMAALLNSKCELLFTFIYDQTSRFIGHTNEKVIAHLEGLFGSSGFRDASSLSGEERKLSLLGLFESQLRDDAGFEYVHSFEMINERGKTPYFLIHASNHIKGAEKIKDVLWSMDPTGDFTYSSLIDGRQMRFNDEIDIGPLVEAMTREFGGGSAPIRTVEDFVIGDTPFAKKHARQALKILEASEKITVANRRRRNTYPPGSSITFGRF